MTWANLLGLCCAMATALLLAPWASGPVSRSVSAATSSDPTPPPRWSLRRGRHDALADDVAVQRYLEALTRSVRAGRTLNQALDDLARRQRPHEGPRLLHDALVLASTAGTSPAAVMERAAAVAADRVAARQERRAQAAQARLSATVLTWVPVGVAGLAIAVDADVRHVMLATPWGWTCLGVGGALGALGRRWIRRMTEGPAS